jgi:hypothetical protein
VETTVETPLASTQHILHDPDVLMIRLRRQDAWHGRLPNF